MDAVALLLATAFRHVINEPNFEAAYERFAVVSCNAMDEGAFREAVAVALRDRLIREPIRLPEGVLQCHWHLELTPQGIALAQALQREMAGRHGSGCLG